MKTSRILLTWTLMSLLSVAVAGPSGPGRNPELQQSTHQRDAYHGSQSQSGNIVVDVTVLVQFDAIVGFCAKANPGDAQRYFGLLHQVTAGVPETLLEQARSSQDYRTGLRAMRSILDNVPPGERSATCTALFASAP